MERENIREARIMVIAPIVAQVAIPAAIQALSKLLPQGKQQEPAAVAASQPTTDPAQQQLLAGATGKGLKINTYA
jgi:hypothetical protein